MPRRFEMAAETLPERSEAEDSGVKKLKEQSFDDLPDQAIVRNYWPTFVGKGGENLVYEVLTHPDVVIKVDQETLANTIGHAVEMGLDPGNESLRTDEIQEGKLKRARESFREVKRVFGAEHVLAQKQYLLKVPVNKTILKQIGGIAKNRGWKLPDEQADIDSAWSIVTVQKRTDKNEDPRHLSTAVGNLEVRSMRDLREALGYYMQYSRVTNGLASSKTAEQVSTSQLELLYAGTPFAKLLRRAENSPLLQEALMDFQKKAVQFANETGQIIDIVGKDNIVFNEDADGNWNYTLIDPLYGFDYDIIKHAREGFRNASVGLPYSGSVSNAMMQVANFARVINGLGVALGTGVYFDVLTEDLQDVNVAKSVLGF